MPQSWLKYVLHPGECPHRETPMQADELMEIYELRPEQCLIWGFDTQGHAPGYVHLYPIPEGVALLTRAALEGALLKSRVGKRLARKHKGAS